MGYFGRKPPRGGGKSPRFASLAAREHDDRDHPPAGASLVGLVAVVVVVDESPQLLALVALGDVCRDRESAPIDLDVYGVRVGAEVVVPAGMVRRAPLRGDDHEVLAA